MVIVVGVVVTKGDGGERRDAIVEVKSRGKKRWRDARGGGGGRKGALGEGRGRDEERGVGRTVCQGTILTL